MSSAHRIGGRLRELETVTGWTGKSACVLQAALRLSNEAFASQLGIGVRTVASWHQKPDLRPRPEMQQLLDTAFAQADKAAKDQLSGLSAARASGALPFLPGWPVSRPGRGPGTGAGCSCFWARAITPCYALRAMLPAVRLRAAGYSAPARSA